MRRVLLLEEFVEAVPDAIITVDHDGRIVLVNSQAEKLFGYSRTELLGQLIEMLLPERFRSLHLAQRVEFNTSPRTRPMGIGLELIARRKDGSEFPSEISLRPMQTEDGLLITSAIRDVTERKRAEEERAQLTREQAARAEAEAAQRRFAFLAEASSVLASSLDYDQTLASVARLVVPTLADWCVVDVVEADQSIRHVATAHREPAKAALLAELQRRYSPEPSRSDPRLTALRTGRADVVAEVPDSLLAEFARDAEELEAFRELGIKSYMIVPLVTRGLTLGVITFVLAESDRRYGPADLALAEDLAQRTAVAVDNARLYHMAKEAIRARDEFLSTVSHDLKNPLALIKGRAQLLKRQALRAGIPETERLVDGLATIDATTTKMTGLINELLDLMRLQIGQPLALERAATDLVALARQAIVNQPETTSHRLRVETDLERLEGRWDAHRLDRVLANLLSNAIKYSPAGGDITITLACERGPQDEETAVLAVQDEGVGIPAADLPRVFDRFYRGRNVVGQFAGTGIGLAGVRQIVEQHGGTIAVASTEGIGTTVTVRLPLAPPDLESGPDDLTASAPPTVAYCL